MKDLSRREFQLAALATMLAGGTAVAQGQPWPSKAVRAIVPYATGGSTDGIARPVLDGLTERLKQPFVLENREGAGSAIGSSAVARSAPDGYTLLVNSPAYITTLLISKPDYQFESFDPVALLATTGYVILVRDNSPIKNVKDLVEAARAKGGNFLYASAGIGSSTHFITEYFCMRTNVRMKHVPFKGIAPAMIALLGGDVDVVFTTPASGSPQIMAGTARVLAYTSAQGSPPGFPPAPTVRESGLDYDTDAWFVMLAPKGTPEDVRQKLNANINEIMKTPELARAYAILGAKPAIMSLQQISDLTIKEMALWTEVAKFADIKPQG